MRTQSTEFDRTHSKTHKSRYIKFTPSSERGFTLIELLVVISIIALLSTIVLAVVTDGRTKAKNSAKNSMVLEYVKALELYRSNNGSYPTVSVPTCFGFGSSEKCYGNLDGSDALKYSMNPYIPGDFASRQPLVISGLDMRGVLYSCTGTNCSSYTLQWILEDNVSKCMNNSTSIPFPNNPAGPHIYCNHTLN